MNLYNLYGLISFRNTQQIQHELILLLYFNCKIMRTNII